ncbi:MAG: hypothetical protein J6S02_01400 [Bacteroidaceae bacterium]|nr:hypothetical protein [Bacteroidaceae bacterium]
MYCGFVTNLKNVRPHPNADRMKLADCFGNTVCVGLSAQENDVVIYFPTDGQLSVEYCAQNDLVRRKDENGNPAGGYLDPDKRNVKAIKLRGEKSDGITMPLESLAYTGVDLATLTVGTQVTVINGHDICTKYIPKSNSKSSHSGGAGNKTRKRKDPVAPLFAEHADTEQLAYNLSAFKCGDEVEITLKMHGTSQRTGHLPTLQGYKRTLWDKITRKAGTPIYNWGGVSGTRRVVLEDYDGGFYGSNEFREHHSKAFDGKLMKGETVYYEVVGFTTTGQPIMSTASNKKLNDKEFIKQYGEETVFSYGCKPVVSIDCDDLQSDIYVYRMTMTNEDGFVVEYTPDFMRYRCEQMGVKTVPVLWKGTIPDNPGSAEDPTINAGEWIKNVAERFYDGPDPVGKTHVREGVVVRILNRPKFAAYKHKNFAFKVLEGIIKESAEAPDMEEAQEVADV